MPKVTYLPNGVVHFLYPTRRDLTLSFCRIEEFYESPHGGIRGQRFSMDDFIEEYALADGTLTFFKEWDGFNIPRKSLDAFVAANTLRGRERRVVGSLRADTKYVIATEVGSDPTTYEHEMAHARWATDAEYFDSCKKVLDGIPTELREELYEALLAEGYSAPVLADEVHAYLKTSDDVELRELFPDTPLEALSPYRTEFAKVT